MKRKPPRPPLRRPTTNAVGLLRHHLVCGPGAKRRKPAAADDLLALRRSLGPKRESTDGVEKGVTPGQTSPHREGSAWPADLPTAGTPEGAAASDATSLTNPQEEEPVAMFWQSVEELEGEKRRCEAHAKRVARHQRKRLSASARPLNVLCESSERPLSASERPLNVL